MKTFHLIWILLFPMVVLGQFTADEKVTISDPQADDIYLAGANLDVNAPVHGDIIAAGSDIYLRDSVYQDVIAAGSEIWLNGHVSDDVRAAAGKITVHSEIGDDLILFGGDIHISEEAIIRGNLTVFAGRVQLDGAVTGDAKISAGSISIDGSVTGGSQLRTDDLWFNGTVEGPTTLIAQTLNIGSEAQFYGDVTYWTEAGEMDFGNSLKNVNANFDPNLIDQDEEYPIGIVSITSFGFWLFYIISAFLLILLLNVAFRQQFKGAAGQLDDKLLKSLGNGLIYILGLPIIIVFCMVIIVGIPIGLFLLGIYFFSLLFGHAIAALIITYYLNNRNEKSWNFWTIALLSLGIAIIIRLITLLPFLGVLISLLIIAVAYGAVYLYFMDMRASKNIKAI